MPLTAPALAYIAITTFQHGWEDFMGPLLYLQHEQLYTLQLGLRQYESAAGGAPAWNWIWQAVWWSCSPSSSSLSPFSGTSSRV